MEQLPWSAILGAWWPAALLGSLGAGALVSWLLPRWRARRNWRRAVALCGEPSVASPERAGEAVTISGRLEAIGPIAAFADGAEVAVCGVEGYADGDVTDCAVALVLRTAAGTIDLETGVDLLSGSLEQDTGLAPHQLAAPVAERLAAELDPKGCGPVRFRRLIAGDHLRARGTLKLIEDDDGDGYRLALHDAVLVSESPPRVRGPSPRRMLGAAALAAVACVIALSVAGAI